MQRLHFQCTSIEERLVRDETEWWVSLMPYPVGKDNGEQNGRVAYGGRDGGLTLRVFAKALAHDFVVGEIYQAGFERVDPPR